MSPSSPNRRPRREHSSAPLNPEEFKPPGYKWNKSQDTSVANDVPLCLLGDHPGVFLSGAPGSGKSNTAELFLRKVVEFAMSQTPGSALDAGLLFIDPHGLSAHKFYRWCLDQGKRVASRVLYLHFADTRKIPTFDVLHVPGDDVGSIGWYGRLAFITELLSKIQLSAWGETDFNSKPVLFKNSFRVNYTLAHAGLPWSMAKMFGDVHDPLYSTMCRAVPDVLSMDRAEMEGLPDLRPADLSAALDSWKNRTFGSLSNPLFEAIVSRTAADGAFTMQQLYGERLFVIVNLEQGGVLRQMDQEILANALLTLSIFTAMSTPADRRHLHINAVDELPVFKSSTDLLATIALPQCRKYLIRTLACSCGPAAFPEGVDDKLLQAFLAFTGARLYFRHNGELDCSWAGRQIGAPAYSPMYVKYRHSQPMQFQDGDRIVVLTDTNDTVGVSDTEGESEKNGSNHAENWNDQTTATTSASLTETKDRNMLRQAVTDARATGTGRLSGRGGSAGSTHETSRNRAHAKTESHGITHKQQLVPIVKTVDIVTSVSFFTKEELDASGGALVSNQDTGQCVLHVSGSPPVQLTFPIAEDPFALTPKFAKKREVQHQAAQEEDPGFAGIEEIQAQRQHFLSALLERLTRIAYERPPDEVIHVLPDPHEPLPPAAGDTTF